jgi:hypothetical protein
MMRRNDLIAAMILMAAALTSSALMAAPIPVSTIVFLQYDHAQGPALGINVNGSSMNAATGEYVFKLYSANQSAGTLTQGAYLGNVAVWCLTPFATTGSDAVAFAFGNGNDIGQLHDVPSITDAEADNFYRDTTAMYQLYNTLGAGLHDDLQAAIWERRDMIEGPALTKSTSIFDINNDANKGQFWVPVQTNIPSISQFASLIPASGPIWDLYTPIGSGAVSAANGDVQLGNDYYSYNHSKQEFGYVATHVPEPSSLLLLGGGMLVAAGLLRRKK